jgi:outer membrane protein, heavy metal efflux system
MKITHFLFFLGLAFPGLSQNFISYSLAQADSVFIKNNLMLLAGQYNVGTKDALIIQARAYPNPLITVDINAYDPENDRFFHVNQTGQKAFAIEQVIRLGGKRKEEINIAKQNKRVAELELDDLLRSLQYQLHTSFYIIHQQRITLEKFTRQLNLLDTLITSYENQSAKGNLPLKDVVRLKSVYFKINNDKSELANVYFAEQQKIQLLLQSNTYVLPLVNDQDFDRIITETPLYNNLLEAALEGRPDLKIADESEAITLMNLALQKKMVAPDLAVNTSYDQRGGAFRNQVNVGVSMALPMWDRNKGNIKAAQYETQTAELYRKQKSTEVEAEVMAAWQDIVLSISEYQKIKKFYSSDFDVVFDGVNKNFKNRNISILEFVDFFESYNESLSEFERVKNYVATSAMQINYVTASKIY